MKNKITILIIFIIIFSNFVFAGIGFGMTEIQTEIVMKSNEDSACAVFYLFNPGDIDIEGYLDVEKDSGKTLNKLLLLNELYKDLEDYEKEINILSKKYLETAEKSISTFEIEKQINEIKDDINILLKEIESRKPTQKVKIPAHTSSKDISGNYQIPINICFNRPKEKYLLFFNVGNNEYCGIFEGEIVGKYIPLRTSETGTGSTVIGSRSANLKIKVECDTKERNNLLIVFISAIVVFITLLLIVILILWKKQTKKLNLQTAQTVV